MNFLTRCSKRREPQYSDDLRLANYPPPYPGGWYRLLQSKSLRRGQVRYLECLGRALVVWLRPQVHTRLTVPWTRFPDSRHDNRRHDAAGL